MGIQTDTAGTKLPQEHHRSVFQTVCSRHSELNPSYQIPYRKSHRYMQTPDYGLSSYHIIYSCQDCCSRCCFDCALADRSWLFQKRFFLHKYSPLLCCQVYLITIFQCIYNNSHIKNNVTIPKKEHMTIHVFFQRFTLSHHTVQGCLSGSSMYDPSFQDPAIHPVYGMRLP